MFFCPYKIINQMHACLHQPGNSMKSLTTLTLTLVVLLVFSTLSTTANAGNSKVFREYIGAESDSVKLSDLPINSGVEFHFILAFALDYSTDDSSSHTNGKFNIFWETDHLGPGEIASIKDSHKNVKVGVSLGGDSVGNGKAFFKPSSINSWVNNAVSSLTTMIKTYHLDGIDIDYEHFSTDPETFAECIGQLIVALKKSGVISFASIAPYEGIQTPYLALWRKYGHVIDYVNFQFYAYDKGISVSQFIEFFNTQASNYDGGQILPSFISDGSGGLGPDDGFFEACSELKGQGKLEGIFVWCADEYVFIGLLIDERSYDASK